MKRLFDAKLLWSLMWAVGLTVLMLALEYWGWLAGPEGKVMDILLRPHTLESLTAGSILTVGIDDDSYRQCFASASPLHEEIVIAMVKDLACTGAKTIGVDILTESPGYASAPSTLGPSMEKIIWISGAGQAQIKPPWIGLWLIGRDDKVLIKPTPVLGLDPGALDEHGQIHWGVPVFARDDDLRLRLLPQQVDLSADPQHSRLSMLHHSFARSVAEAFCASCVADKEIAEPIYVQYRSHAPASYSVSDVFDCTGTAVRKGRLWNKFAENAKDKIVLLGGTFAEGRDFYDTPIGNKPGLLINAFAVESELTAGVMHEQWRPVAATLDLAVGFAIVLIFWWFEPEHHGNASQRIRIPMACSAVLVVTVSFGLWGFRPEYVPGMVGIVLGVMAHELVEIWREENAAKHGVVRD